MPTPIRFHRDEHVSPAVAAGLRLRGIDVTTAAEAGLGGADDLRHLEYAHREGRVIVTHDRHFPVWHSRREPHAEIAKCHQLK